MRPQGNSPAAFTPKAMPSFPAAARPSRGASSPATSLSVTVGTDLIIENLPYGAHIVAESNPGEVTVADYSYVYIDGTSESSQTVSVGETPAEANLVNLYTKESTFWTPQVHKLLNNQDYTGQAYSFSIADASGHVIDTVYVVIDKNELKRHINNK